MSNIYESFDSPYGTDHKTALDKAVTYLMQISVPIKTNWALCCGDRKEVSQYWDWYNWSKACITKDTQDMAILSESMGVSIESNLAEPVHGNLESHAIQLVQSPEGYHLLISRIFANDGEATANGTGNQYDGAIWTSPKTGEISQNIWYGCAITRGSHDDEDVLRQLLQRLVNHSKALRSEARHEESLWDRDLTKEEESLKEQGLGFLVGESKSPRNKRNAVPESMSEEVQTDYEVNDDFRAKWITDLEL